MRGHQIVAIARFIVLEALRTRLFWLFVAVLDRLQVTVTLGYVLPEAAQLVSGLGFLRCQKQTQLPCATTKPGFTQAD